MKVGLVGDIRSHGADNVGGGDAALGWESWSRKGLRDVGLSGALSRMLNVAICGEGKL